MQFDSPIRTIDEAKCYFQAMGCTSFHMSREYPERYEEYRKLGISNEIEAGWAAEKISATIELLKRSDTNKADLWWIHSNLVDLLANWQIEHFLEEVLDVTNAIVDSLPPSDLHIVAATIIGQRLYPPGLIVQSHDAGRAQLARRFAELTHRLLAKIYQGADLDKAPN